MQFNHIKRAVAKNGLTMRAFLARAKIHESTWYRWTRAKNPLAPNTRTLNKVHAALARLEKTPRKRR